ncbi:hypothetical protein [Dactylosporangium maewongense]|uniref:hypothetical protein n=1 Tax=Dactylosporangium maewongense TaxID=634393 RepID=UPI0031CEE12C
MNTDDLAAVREFRADLDEPREGALAEGRWKLAGAAIPERTAPRRTWILATAGAAVAVAAVVGAAAAVPTTRPRQEQAQTPGQSAPAQTQPAGVDLPVTHGTKAPMRPPVAGKAGGDHAAAVAALTRIAGQQRGGPLPIGAGQVLYVKTYNLIDGTGSYIHEVWQDPGTGVALRIRRSDDGPKSIDHSLSDDEIALETARAHLGAPGLDNMKAEYVAAFPREAAKAHELSAAWRAWAAKAYPGRNADGMIFKYLHEVFHYVEPLLDAQQRAALYQALADLAVEATTASIGGRQYDVICMADAQKADCLLVDAATGRFAGGAWTGADLKVTAGNFEFVDFATQPRPVPGATRDLTQEKPGASGSSTTPKR